ncbi:MAG: DUF6460 domain-containing protein [Hyphomonas sp.]|nr:DUF6460 domain-containing protein [Hyphomonas sp.]
MMKDPSPELPEVTVEPVPQPPKPRAAAAPPPRSLLARLFGISIWGALKLVGLCILVGFFVLASQFNPSNPDVNIGAAIANVASTTMAALGWAVRNFWKPALAGAAVVIPVWVLWRLVSLPFRK